MTTVNIYLTFNGNCEEAFNFYRSVFGGDFQYVGKYGEMPVQNDIPAVPDNQKDKIMHITLPISKETMLMGNDSLDHSGLSTSDNITLIVETDSKQKADVLCTKLSDGGKISMPMREVFWGSYYGMLTDRFGIKWKVTVDLNEIKP
ncbi:MAG: hypothetical protein JWQ25_1365 [Daejeonella sp.]|nr:hypothetical protein [Daejeonella sp.]